MSARIAPETRSVPLLPELTAIVVLPWLVTMALPDWAYAFPGVIDPWIYNGFFRHLEEYASSMFPGTYYGTRLGWILPGYIAYATLAPATANFVLHLTCYATAVWAMYAVVTACAGRTPALFTAVAFGLYLPVIRTLGDDYVAGAVVVYALLASLAAIRASDRQGAVWRPALSGIAAAAMLHSNIGSVLLLPSVLVWILPDFRRGAAWKALSKSLAAWCGGAAGCTLALAVFSVMHGGRWWFFQENFTWMSTHSAREYAGRTIGWVEAAPWTFLPVALAVSAALVPFVRWRRTTMTVWHIKALASFALAFIPLAAYELLGKGQILTLSYYVSWLYPSAFVMIGAVLLGPRAYGRWWPAAPVVAAGILLLSIARRSSLDIPVPSLLVLTACIVLSMIATAARHVAVTATTVTALLLVMHAELTGFEYSPMRADVFRAVEQATGVTDRFVRSAPPRFLVDDDPRWEPYVTAVTSVYLGQASVLSDTFPAVPAGRAKYVTDGTVVVVVSGDPAIAGYFDEAFAGYGLRGEMLTEQRIATAAGELHLTVLRARSLSELPTGQRRAPGEVG